MIIPHMRQLIPISLILALFSGNATASYAIYVGKNLTRNGSVFIGGSGDEVSSHWLEIVPARDHAKDAVVTVGVTDEVRTALEGTAPDGVTVAADGSSTGTA